MDLDMIKGLAKELMIKRRVHREREEGGAYYHGERVANIAVALRERILPRDPSHDDVITVAAWFHDVGKGLEPHNEFGALIAGKALGGYCTKTELDEIMEIISLHFKRCPKNNTYSDWVKLVQDSDILDHYGTFTIWADFLNSAYNHKSMEQSADKTADWEKSCQWAYGALNYDVSKQILEEKVRFVNEFYKRFKIESKGKILEGIGG